MMLISFWKEEICYRFINGRKKSGNDHTLLVLVILQVFIVVTITVLVMVRIAVMLVIVATTS